MPTLNVDYVLPGNIVMHGHSAGDITGAGPDGADTNVQFNDGGSFGGEDTLKFSKTNLILTLGREGENAVIQSPVATTDATNGGGLSFIAGHGGPVSGDGGSFSMEAGPATSGDSSGGDISFQGGIGVGGGEGGDIIFVAGASATGTDGKIKIRDGASSFYANLDTSSISTDDKTYTFPNTTGTFTLTETIGNTAVLKTGSTMTGELNIEVPTTTTEALTLKTTDDNSTKNLLEIKNSAGAVKAAINSSGKVVLSAGLSGPVWTNYVIVDQGGKGDYTTITTALAWIATQSPSASNRFIVNILPGTYTENVSVPAYTVIRSMAGNVLLDGNGSPGYIVSLATNGSGIEDISIAKTTGLTDTGTINGIFMGSGGGTSGNYAKRVAVTLQSTTGSGTLRGIHFGNATGASLEDCSISVRGDGKDAIGVGCAYQYGVITRCNISAGGYYAGSRRGILITAGSPPLVINSSIINGWGSSNYDIDAGGGTISTTLCVLINGLTSGTVTQAPIASPTILGFLQTTGSTNSNDWILTALAATDIPLTLKGFASQSADLQNWISSTSAVLAKINAGGDLTLSPSVRTTGSPSHLTVTGAAHTTLTASTEAPDVNLNLGRTVQFATGAITAQRALKILAPTYGFVGASTVSDAATAYIEKAPVAGTNATFTRKYALWIDDDISRFDGGIAIDGATAVNVTSGVYTPTRSAEANLDATVTMTEAQYMRVGNTVTVSGRFTSDPTLTATATSFEITLPIASNIGAVEDAAGVFACGTVAGMSGAITGSVANNTAVFTWVSTDITSQTSSYTFSYQVI